MPHGTYKGAGGRNARNQVAVGLDLDDAYVCKAATANGRERNAKLKTVHVYIGDLGRARCIYLKDK